jgi:hypothetical protein
MGTASQITGSFLASLSLVGVSIYYFIENENMLGRVYIFLAVYAFITLFYILRSIYYLRHKATFNEIIFVFILPLIPVIILYAQMGVGINDMFVVLTGTINTDYSSFDFNINMFDLLLLPYYLASNFLLFRSLIRYPFIRFRGTSEKGIPPKLMGVILILLIPALYIASSLTYLNNIFLLIFGVTYFYLGTIAFVV